MSNTKISALTSATTPLAGTETLPIVQSGVTKQVSVDNLTTGKDVSARSYTASFGSPGYVISNQGTVSARSTYSNTGGTFYFGIDSSAGGLSVPYAINFYYTGAYPIVFSINNAERMRIASAGDVTVAVGNIIPSTAAKGINFTANTPAAGMTSQLLNWYEEGTWAPVASGDSGSLTAYTSSGRYTRIGKEVFLQGSVTLTTVGTAGGRMVINGLPFTLAAGSLGPSGTCREQAATGVMYMFFGAAGGTNGYIASTIGGSIVWLNSYSYAFNMTYSV